MSRSEVYSLLYRMADHILREHNPCQIRTVGGRTSCTRSRKEKSIVGPTCCTNCEHLGPNGCTVESLGCKLAGCHSFSLPLYVNEAALVNASLHTLRTVAETKGIDIWASVRKSKAQYFSKTAGFRKTFAV